MSLTIYPEPEWGTPQEAVTACSSINSTGPTPFIMTGVFTSLLKYHFSDSDNILNPMLKSIHWSANGVGQQTELEDQLGNIYTLNGNIFIGPSGSTDPASANMNPALFVKREPVSIKSISLLNVSLPSMKHFIGKKKGAAHQMTVEGSHSIICKGKTVAEADSLSEEVFYRMLHFQSVIRDDFQLGSFKPVGISAVKELEGEAEKSFYAVVSLKWAYVYRWALRLEAPVIKRTNLMYIE